MLQTCLLPLRYLQGSPNARPIGGPWGRGRNLGLTLSQKMYGTDGRKCCVKRSSFLEMWRVPAFGDMFPTFSFSFLPFPTLLPSLFPYPLLPCFALPFLIRERIDCLFQYRYRWSFITFKWFTIIFNGNFIPLKRCMLHVVPPSPIWRVCVLLTHLLKLR